LNRNSFIRFPLVEDSDLSCTDLDGDDCGGGVPCTGGRSLPNSFLLDARFFLFGQEHGQVYLKSAVIDEDGSASAVVTLPGRGDVEVGSSGIWSENRQFSVRLVFGARDELARHAGKYRLCKPARFIGSRVMSVPYGIGADTLTCGGVTACGEIRVVDGQNSSLDIDRNNLVLSLRKGLGLGVSCPTASGSYLCDGSVLYYLNGQKADSSGNIDIIGGDGVSVTTGTYNGIPAVIVLTSPSVNSFVYR